MAILWQAFLFLACGPGCSHTVIDACITLQTPSPCNTLCMSCGSDFPFSSGDPCMKCSKVNSAISDSEKEAILVMPQCDGCGCCFPYLKEKRCGSCTKRLKPRTDSADLDASSILENAGVHENEASKHRLNQLEPKGPQTKRLEALKEKEAALKQQRKAEMFTLEAYLVLFPFGKTTSKKIQMSPLLEKVNGDEIMDVVINRLLQRLESTYLGLNIPKLEPLPSFERNKISLNIVYAGAKTRHVDDEITAFKTMSVAHSTLKDSGYLCEKDKKGKSISFRVDIFEIGGSKDSDGQDESDDDFTWAPSKTTLRSKRSSVSKPKSSAKRSDLESARPSRQPPAKRYASTFATPSPGSDFESAAPLTFDSFQFMRTYCIVGESGDVTAVKKSDSETILIGNDWQQHKFGNKPAGTYIGKGYSKYAFRGVIQSENYAIFQSRPLGNAWFTAAENANGLLHELKTLHMAQYFLESYKTRATTYKYKDLPNLRFNVAKSFLGTVLGDVAGPPANTEDDQRPLVYKTFLAAPFIPTGDGYIEQKWSGTDQAGDNSSILGCVMDAFAHHSLVDSNWSAVVVDLQGICCPNGEVILFDPQMHTSWQGDKVQTDRGQAGIDDFLKGHKCNRICKALQLHSAVPLQPRPWDL